MASEGFLVPAFVVELRLFLMVYGGRENGGRQRCSTAFDEGALARIIASAYDAEIWLPTDVKDRGSPRFLLVGKPIDANVKETRAVRGLWVSTMQRMLKTEDVIGFLSQANPHSLRSMRLSELLLNEASRGIVTTELCTDLMARFQICIKSLGEILLIDSGLRTYVRQQVIFHLLEAWAPKHSCEGSGRKDVKQIYNMAPILLAQSQSQVSQDSNMVLEKDFQSICKDRNVRFGTSRTPASSLLNLLWQTRNKKASLLSQIGRGKQNSSSSAPFQILIKPISGKTLLQWARTSDLVQGLKQALEIKLRIPSTAQILLHEGKQLEDLFPLSFYSIQRNSSIALTLRLRGGAAGQSSSAEAFSYKDVVHAKMPKRTVPPAQAPKPFLVDKLEETPSIEIKHPLLDEQTQHFADHGIICRFNGLWPRTADLYQWVQSNWTNNCKVLLCSKGFFIVVFAFDEDYQKALSGGPWFWGAAGLFLTPWFPDFDPSTAVITKLPIWVRLPNLPANLWHFAVFQGIAESLGHLLDTDVYRGEKGLYTFARICVEIDISKGLSDQINLKIGDFHWTQSLDYENTAFRCCNCHHTGHLQSSYPTMPAQKKKANAKQKSKSWKPHDPPPMDDFDFNSDEEEENKEDMAAATEPVPSSAGPVVSSVIPASQKRNHESSTSDSEKETSPLAHLSMQIIPAQQDPPEWVKVGKKKGKKSRIVDSAHVG